MTRKCYLRKVYLMDLYSTGMDDNAWKQMGCYGCIWRRLEKEEVYKVDVYQRYCWLGHREVIVSVGVRTGARRRVEGGRGGWEGGG